MTNPSIGILNIASGPHFFARYSPHRPAIRFEDETTTWAEFDERIRRVATGFRQAGISFGSRVGLLLRNHPAFLETVFAAAHLGAMVAPLNIRHTAAEIRDCVERGEISILISEEHFADLLQDLDGAIEESRIHLVDGGDRPSIGRAYDDWLSEPPEQGAATQVRPDDPFLLMYTSGTSGRPKGALLTYSNVLAQAAGTTACDGTGPDDRLFLPVPLAFSGPLISSALPVLAAGGCVGLEQTLNLDALVADLDAGWPTTLIFVPMVYEQLARHPRFDRTAFDSVRVAKTGGAPVGNAVVEAFDERGLAVVGSYGLTECGGLATQLPRDQALTRIGSAGLPMLGHDLKVVVTDDEPLAPGEIGEILLRGPAIMAGYDGDPVATESALRDGWLHTGDLGEIDGDGFLKVVGRQKEMIISGGLNISPAEIERVIGEYPGIDEVAVVARTDPRFGEVPVACVVSGEADVPLDGLRLFLEGHLADYKRPRELIPYDELPRGMSGKVLKEQLKEEVEDRVRQEGR